MITRGCGLTMYHRDAQIIRDALHSALASCDDDATASKLLVAKAMLDGDASHHGAISDYCDGSLDLSRCDGCGAVWMRTDEFDDNGVAFEQRTLIEAGDGSCRTCEHCGGANLRRNFDMSLDCVDCGKRNRQ